MKNRIQKLGILALFSILTVTSCNNGKKPVSATISPSIPVSSNNSSAAQPDDGDSYELVDGMYVYKNYDAYIDKHSQAGHLYIHYLRQNNTPEEYQQWGLWLWPKGEDGGLFAASSKPGAIQHVNTNGWMSVIGTNIGVDQAGACADIDLNATNYVTGKEGEPMNFKDLNVLGYLVVKLASMGGGTHWTSDGGADSFVDDMNDHKRANGAIHIFLKQGDALNPRFFFSQEAYENPTVTDETGMYRSTRNIQSSIDQFSGKISPTSKKFYETGGVGYQVFIPTFRDSDGDGMGDLQGVIDSLDYLESLHVDTLWLTPFLKSASYHGYDTTDYFEIDERYGTKEILRELIKKAHDKGIKVLMDLVINHSSLTSVWFKKAQRAEKGIDSKGNEFNYRDIFYFKFEGDMVDDGNKKVKVEDSGDWYRDGESKYFYFAKFASNMPEFNYDAQITRDLMQQVAQYWLGFGMDGYRLDAVKHIYMKPESENAASDVILEDSGSKDYWDEQLQQMVHADFDYSVNTTKNVIFWKDFAMRLKAIYPDCYLVAENFDGWDERIAPYYQAFDSQFDFATYYHNMQKLYFNNNRTGYAYSLAEDNQNKYNNFFRPVRSQFINAPFTSNHDVMRAINYINGIKNSVGTDIIATGKVTGTAEQVGRAKVNMAITTLLPGISYIYYGDELGMSSNTDENDKGNDNNLDRFYRQPMLWKESEARPSFKFSGGFKIELDSYNKTLGDVEDQATDQNSMLYLTKLLTGVKADPKFPKNGTYQAVNLQKNDLYCYYISPTVTGQKKYKIIIHTGCAEDNSGINYTVDSGMEVVLKYNATDSKINRFGVVVMRAK